LNSFWQFSECGVSSLHPIARQVARASSAWHHALADFPNGLAFRDAYITYLIEALALCSEAVFQQTRLDLIAIGVDFLKKAHGQCCDLDALFISERCRMSDRSDCRH
jgi:hypothetical protein